MSTSPVRLQDMRGVSVGPGAIPIPLPVPLSAPSPRPACRDLQQVLVDAFGHPGTLQALTGAASIRVAATGPGIFDLWLWLDGSDVPCRYEVAVRPRV